MASTVAKCCFLLTPAEQKAVLTVLLIILLGIAAKFWRQAGSVETGAAEKEKAGRVQED